MAIHNRTRERAQQLARELGADVAEKPLAADVLVNCTSVGLRAAEDELAQLALDEAKLDGYALVVDLAYRDGDTELVRAARAHGARTVDGLDVLVAQGALSLELWTGRKAPLAVMHAAARAR